MRKFLRESDKLGYSPQMSYKKNASFGTSIGGCSSLCARCFTFSYTIIILVGFIAERDYDLNFQVLNQDRAFPDMYDLSGIDFIPAIGIYYDNALIGTDTHENFFKLKWQQYSNN